MPGVGIGTGVAFEGRQRAILDVASVVPSALLKAARDAGIVLGTSIREQDSVYAEDKRTFLRSNVDEYISGLAFLPDYLVPNYNNPASTAQAVRFMARAARDGKRAHIHCPVYASRVSQKIVGADAALTAGTIDTAKALIRKLLDAAAVAVPSSFTGTMDIVNEDNDGNGRRAFSILAKFPTVVDFWKFCFDEARLRWPNAKLLICMNNTEEVSYSDFHQFMRFRFLGELIKAQAAGVLFDGVTLQGHCIFDRGTVDDRFVDYLKAIRGMGLSLRLGEIDARASSNPGQNIAAYPGAIYDQKLAEHHAAILNAALPYANAGVSLWTLSDIDNSWKRNEENTANSNERPCVFDTNFQPKPGVLAAVIGALNGRVVATDFYLDPFRELVANGSFNVDLKNWPISLPNAEWVAPGRSHMISTGNSARHTQVWPVIPGQTFALNLERPTGTTGIHVRLSKTLSTGDALTATDNTSSDTTFASTYPQRLYVIPADVYAVAILAQTGNATAGRDAFLDNVSFKRVA